MILDLFDFLFGRKENLEMGKKGRGGSRGHDRTHHDNNRSRWAQDPIEQLGEKESSDGEEEEEGGDHVVPIQTKLYMWEFGQNDPKRFSSNPLKTNLRTISCFDVVCWFSQR